MRTSAKLFVRGIGVVLGLAIASAGLTPAHADAGTLSGDQLAALRAALDTAPKDPGAPVNAAKAAKHAAFMRNAKGFNAAFAKASGKTAGVQSIAVPQTTCTPDDPCAKTVGAITQVPQQNGYYCGPATLVELVKARSVSISQATAASTMHTTTNGTDWYNGSTYPMATGLNTYLGPSGAIYVPVGLSGSPSTTEKNNYMSDLYDDVMNNWGIAGDAYEVVGGPHLVGHPNSNIFHWFAIRGFESYGASTRYTDSVYGATSISWYSSVPAYSTMSSNTIAVIMGGRGYVW
jgi:hypothetical protein